MTYDPHRPPGATQFSYGAPSRRSRRPLVGVVAAAAVIAAGAVGAVALSAGDETPGTKAVAPVAKRPVVKRPVAKQPAPKKKPGLTTDRRVVIDALKTLVIAEESYAIEHDGTYTTRLAALEAEGFAPDPRVKVRVLHLARGGYCLSAAGAGRLVFYYESRAGQVSRTSCA